jgi:hypothetical protein
MVALTVVGALLTPKPQGPLRSGLGDFTFPTAQEGRAIPIIAGTVKVGGPNVVWWGDLSTVPVKMKAGLFSSTTVGYKYFLGIQMTLAQGPIDDVVAIQAGNKAVPFTKSPAGVNPGGDLISLHVDAPKLFGGTGPGGTGGLAGLIQIYGGTKTQNPDSYLSKKQTAKSVLSSYSGTGDGSLSFLDSGDQSVAETITITAGANLYTADKTKPYYLAREFSVVGSVSGAIGTAYADYNFADENINFTIASGSIPFAPGDHWTVITASKRISPAYRGVCYAVLEGWTSGGFYVGTSSSPQALSFVLRRLPDPFAWGKADSRVNLAGDANPALWIYEIMTDQSNGLGILPTDVNASSFQAAAVTLKNEALGVSMQIDSQGKADQIIGEILRHIDGVVWIDPITGLWNITLARADYDPDTILELTVDDILGTPQFARGSWSETTNQVCIRYLDRGQNFNPESVQVQDTANIAFSEEVRTQTIDFNGLSNRANAMLVAIRVLRTLAYPISKVTFQTTRKAWNLRIGSVFKWTWAPLGIDGVVYRVTRIAFGEVTDGKITIDAVEDIFGLSFAVYDPPPDSGWTDPGTTLNGTPAAPAFEQLEEAPYGLTANVGIYVMTLVARADLTESGYQVWQDLGKGYTQTAEISSFTPLGLLEGAYSAATPARDTTGFTLQAAGIDLNLLESTDIGGLFAGANLALIDEELVSFRTVTVNIDGTITLGDVIRGAYDTIPVDHASGAQVYIVSLGAGLTQSIGYGGDAGGGGSGPPGTPGAPGSVWYEGTTVPSSGTGVDGDYYLRTTTGDYYTKTSGSWGSPIGNLTGPPGPAPSGAGNQVVATPDGSSGVSALRALVAADIPALAESKITNLVSDLGTLAGAVSAEASTRATADSSEASARASADSSEASTRATADSTNAAAIAAETSRATAAEALAELLSHKDAASGYAGLDSGSKLKATEFPALTGDVTTVAGAVSCTVGKIQGNVIDNTVLGPGQDGYVACWVNSAGKITFVDPTAANGANAIQIRGKSIGTAAASPLSGQYFYYNGTSYIPIYERGFVNSYWARACITQSNVAAMGQPDCDGAVQWKSYVNTVLTIMTAVGATATEKFLCRATTTASAVSYVTFGNAEATRTFTLGILKWFRARVRFNQATNTRWWVGLGDLALTANTAYRTDTPASNFVGFRFSPTTGGDAKVQCITQTDASHQTKNAETTASHADTSIHIFEFYFDGTNIVFYIDGVQVGSQSGNMPATSVTLDLTIWMDNGGTTTAGSFDADHVIVTDGGGI